MAGSGDVGGSTWETGDPLVQAALAAVADRLPVATVGADGRFTRVSPAFAALTGHKAEDHLDRAPADLLGEVGAVLSEALAGPGSYRELELRGRTGEDREVAWVATLVALPSATGDGAGGVAVQLSPLGPEQQAGVPAAPDDLGRLELLTRAGELLASSLEPARTLENLCDLLVPAVADHVFIDVHDGDVLRRVAIRHVPGTRVPPGLERPVGLPATYAPSHPAQLAFDHGEVLLVPDARDDGGRIPHGKDTELFRAFGVTTAAVLPLRSRDGILGTVVLACSVSERHYDDGDLALMQELVSRAAAAVANSLHFDRQRRDAIELQRALLPPSLEPVEGLDVAWRYVPATDGTEVGGDWADVVELPGGRVAVVVGDVMGRGLRAAAVMGQLRTAVRTLAMQDPPPSDLMTQLDHIVGGLGGDQIVTCVYGVYDPARGTMTVANAGHLPPLLVLDGRCHPLEGVTAVPLGVGGVEFTERVVPMPRGATIALYTDGLVERRGGDLDESVSRLGQSLVEARGTLAERCHTVLMRSAPATAAGFTDDVALLLVQAQSDPTEVTVRHTLPAEPASVSAARRAAARTLGGWGLDDEEVQATGGLLVSELFTNAVLYAQGEQVELTMRRGDHAVWVEVGDRDSRSPRMRHASPDDEGGRGLALVQALSAAWGTRATRDGKVVWIRLDLPRQAGNGDAGRQPA